jgi:hypothetical protein
LGAADLGGFVHLDAGWPGSEPRSRPSESCLSFT